MFPISNLRCFLAPVIIIPSSYPLRLKPKVEPSAIRTYCHPIFLRKQRMCFLLNQTLVYFFIKGQKEENGLWRQRTSSNLCDSFVSLSYLTGPGCQQNNSFDQVTNENQVTSESDSQLGSVLSDILATGLECSMRESSVGYHVQSHCAYARQLQYFVLKS